MEVPTSFGLWLRQRRKALDLTQTDLAECVGCSVVTIRKIEADERRPSRQVAELLANCLEIPPVEHLTFLKIARAELRVDHLAAVPPIVQTIRTPAPSQADSPPGIEISASRHPAGVPAPLTPLIGREHELVEITRLLQNPQCRLLSLIGPGGIGKTRLAIEVAAQQDNAFSDGLYFVSLAPVSTGEFIVPTIASAIGLTFYGPSDPHMQLLSYLRQKQMLLILDNLEHLLPSLQPVPPQRKEPGVEIITDLLHQAPELKLLTTSRERLNLQGEWVFEIQGLPVPPDDLTGNLEDYSAGVLFLQSAQRAHIGFVLSHHEQPAVARICRLMEGLPLGVELAATWVRMLSCTEILQEIERSIDFLAVSARDVSERHRSLRAVFDHSWRLLSPEEQQVLSKLSLFRGGVQREAAEQVAGATLPLLSALVDKSLLRRTAPGRYDLHQLIRQYALEKLQTSGHFEDTSQKYLAFFVALAHEAKVQLRGPQQADWYNRIAREHDNLRTALAWAFDPAAAPERVEQGLTLVTASYRYWQGRGHVREGVMWLERGLQASETISLATRGSALNIAGWLVNHWDDNERARAMLQESVAIHRQLDDELGLGMALDFLGDVAWRDGDFAAAKAFYEESLALYRKGGHTCDIGLSLYSAGRLHVDYGYYQGAAILLNEGLAYLEKEQDWRGIALSLNALGRLALLQGDLQLAGEQFRAALHLNQELGRNVDIAECLEEIAMIAAATGQEQRALRLWSAASTLRQKIGVKMPASDPLYLQAIGTWLSDVASSDAWAEGQALPLEQAIAYALAPDE